MPAATDIKVVNLEFLERRVGKIPDSVFSQRNLTEIGLFFTFKIKQRTAQGKDVHGNMFKPYGAKYAVLREKAGFSSSPVDLFRSGSMMAALQSEPLVSEKAVRLYFLDTVDKEGVRNPVKAAGLNKDRRFFDLSQDEINGAIDIIRRNFVNDIRD